jgi:2-dehydro-3-deoxygalactonokinase
LHGVRTVRDAGDAGLYSRLFSTRALMLDGRLAAGGVPGYLSGLLVGEELRAALAGSEVEPDTSLTLIGNVELCARYHDAAACFGLSTTDTPLADSAARGLWEIANASGLLDSSPDYHAVETQ